MAWDITVNYWAVLLAAIINIVVGGFWYSPLIFGKTWMQIMGFDNKKMKSMSLNAKQAYTIAVIPAVIMSYVLAHFVRYVGASTVVTGMITGAWLWVGFIATTLTGIVLWEGRPFKLYLINSLYYLVVLLINGAILAVWIS
ncbi:DUF1761 domain-containing protein [Candidatus Woesearchaeota archaeon]|nr:DUF1761 domain-containing protein [Candidatus Woesearchaeota archaeon]